MVGHDVHVLSVTSSCGLEGSISDLTFEKVRQFYISRTSELAFYWVEFESLEPRCMVTDYCDL